MKKALRNRYKYLLRQILSSNLSALKNISAINIPAVPILIYSFWVVSWTKHKLTALGIDTRKIMHITIVNLDLHIRSKQRASLHLDALIRKAQVKKTDVTNFLHQKMHGKFYRNVKHHSFSTELTFSYLKSCKLNSDAESLLSACQNGVISTLVYGNRIFHQEFLSLSLRFRCALWRPTSGS